jgi:hypothetical protein
MGSNEFGAASGHRLVTTFGHRIVRSTHARLSRNPVELTEACDVTRPDQSRNLGTRLGPDHYRNALSSPLRDGSLTLGSFFELDLLKK